MIYHWAPGSRVALDPQVAGEELERIAEREALTPSAVVSSARIDTSPLHAAFTWDDDEAARLHREEEARKLIRSLVTIDTIPDREPLIVRAFVHVESAGQYLGSAQALAVADTRQEVLARAWRELETWRRRYEALHEFADIIAAIRDQRSA